MRLTAIVIFILFCLPVHAQQPTSAELEARRKSILESIRQTEEQLEATKNDKKATMGQLRALQSKLAERQRLISNINDEIERLNSNITTSTQEVAHLRENLATLKIRYAQSVRYAYRSRSSYDMLAFLFSSKDFNEALRRMKYLKKIRDYRKLQADEIRRTQGIIIKKIDVLNSEKSTKDNLLTDQEKQKLEIQKETNETNSVVNELKGREKQLQVKVEKDKRAAKQLNKAIQDVIRREIEARHKAEEEARRREEARKAEEARKLAAAQAAAASKGATVAPGINSRPLPEGPINNGKNNTQPAKTNNTAANTQPASSAAVQPPPKTNVAPKNYDLSLTPEANALSNSFESSRGRLPWPVEKGFISQGFGRYHHPIAEKVEMENFGVDISTAHNAPARSVYDGKVLKVLSVDGKEWTVIIQHGDYYTVYTNLSKVSVQAGQDVRTKQPIGTVNMNDEGESIINFQVWKGGTKLNPETWIAR
ncbi:MAG: peptidoglycan DD-metalloendopeptidase family protein [Bacteroidetes bacterium]|nr:peptidoglycan DD-metalloendopeptidase family protein [Bacteroidota bacterium]